jgi:hypothetical protein
MNRPGSLVGTAVDAEPLGRPVQCWRSGPEVRNAQAVAYELPFTGPFGVTTRRALYDPSKMPCRRYAELRQTLLPPWALQCEKDGHGALQSFGTFFSREYVLLVAVQCQPRRKVVLRSRVIAISDTRARSA